MSFDFPFVRLFEFGNFVITLIYIYITSNSSDLVQIQLIVNKMLRLIKHNKALELFINVVWSDPNAMKLR